MLEKNTMSLQNFYICWAEREEESPIIKNTYRIKREIIRILQMKFLKSRIL